MMVLGTSKISNFNRITLVSDAVKKLKVKKGDRVVFEEDEKGRVYIRKG